MSEDEKTLIRYHMGYPNLSMAPSQAAGVPLPTPIMNMLQLSFTLLTTSAEPKVRQNLQRCENIEDELDDARQRMQVAKVDGVEMRVDETDALEREYMRFVGRLSDSLGAPIYPFSERFKSMPSSNKIQVGMVRRVA